MVPAGASDERSQLAGLFFEEEGVSVVECDQCVFGLWWFVLRRMALVLMRTQSATNCLEESMRSAGGAPLQHHGNNWEMSWSWRPELCSDMLLDLAALEAGRHVNEPDAWETNPGWPDEVINANNCLKLDPAR